MRRHLFICVLLASPAMEACGSKHELVIGRTLASGSSVGVGGDVIGSGGASGGGSGSGNASGQAGISGSSSAGAAGGSGAAGVPCLIDEVPNPDSLAHRYNFDGTGTTVSDVVGTAHGELLGGGSLDGSGVLTLDGTDDYINLPNGMISALTNATFVMWTAWRGGSGFQRLFDFGTSSLGEDQRGHGQSYLALSPYVGGDNYLSVLLQGTGIGETQLFTPNTLSDAATHQVALVFAERTRMELYLDGVLLGQTPVTTALSEISDQNNWLGQSQWEHDHNYNGTYAEFRIYREALSPCAVATLYRAGPDVLP